MIEFSIVLVIIALLVAGVVVGSELISSAQLRGVVSQFTKYQTALNSFRLKYNCLPGDCANATRFWGVHSSLGGDINCNTGLGASAAAWDAADLQTGTCNGDGNQRYDYYVEAEQVVAWQQLSSAGLVEGSFKGGKAAGISPTNLASDVTLPRSKLHRKGNPFAGTPEETVFSINPIFTATYIYYSPYTSAQMTTYHDSNHLLVLAGLIASNQIYGGFLPLDAYNIDTKLDDGLPSTGKIISQTHRCAVGNGTTNAYDITYTTHANCTQMMLDAF